MQKSEPKLDSSDDNNKEETDFSDLPDLISVSDNGCDCDADDINSKTFQVFSRLSVLNFGLEKVTEDINSLRKDTAEITVLMKNLCLLLNRRTSCVENIVLNMEENSDEGELFCEHFSSPLYTKIPSQEKRFYLEDDEQEEIDDEEENQDDASEEEEEEEEEMDDDGSDHVQFSEDDDDDPNGLGESTIFD